MRMASRRMICYGSNRWSLRSFPEWRRSGACVQSLPTVTWTVSAVSSCVLLKATAAVNDQAAPSADPSVRLSQDPDSVRGVTSELGAF